MHRGRGGSIRSQMILSRRFRPPPRSRSRNRLRSRTRTRSRLKSRNAQKKTAPRRRRRSTAPSLSREPIRSTAAPGRLRHRRCLVRRRAEVESDRAAASPFGNRFGYYEQLIRDKVARNWRSQDLDCVASATRVVVTFDILRNGSIQNVRVTRVQRELRRGSICTAGDSDVQSVSSRCLRNMSATWRQSSFCSGYSNDKKDTFCFRSGVRGHRSRSLRTAS